MWGWSVVREWIWVVRAVWRLVEVSVIGNVCVLVRVSLVGRRGGRWERRGRDDFE